MLLSMEVKNFTSARSVQKVFTKDTIWKIICGNISKTTGSCVMNVEEVLHALEDLAITQNLSIETSTTLSVQNALRNSKVLPTSTVMCWYILI